MMIKKQRLLKKFTQHELADRLFVDRQYVWRIENGKIKLTLNYLDTVIEQLKCEHSDFIVTKLLPVN